MRTPRLGPVLVGAAALAAAGCGGSTDEDRVRTPADVEGAYVRCRGDNCAVHVTRDGPQVVSRGRRAVRVRVAPRPVGGVIMRVADPDADPRERRLGPGTGTTISLGRYDVDATRLRRDDAYLRVRRVR